MNKLNSYMVFINILNFMRNKDTHSRITDKCRCLFVVAYSAMSITGLSSVLAVENHALSSPVSDRVESVQQKKHVSGNVQDANGMPLIGASVIIKGTNTGMITDIEGNFALDAKQGDIIVISYIGMKSAEVKVPANGQIRVMLKEDSQLMDEVVVTGYGDFKKATYTGSASVLNTDKLESLPVVSVAQMMEANIPGLSSVASSSQPGSKATVRVRAKLLELAGNLAANLLTAHLDKRSQVGQRNRLAAILGRGDLGDNLRRDIASSREAVRLLDQRARDNGAVLEHILQVHQVTVMHVLGKVVRIVEVNQALVVGIHDLLGQQHALRQVLGNLAGHVVALDGVDGRVLVGVLLLDLFVIALNQRQDLVIGRVLLALQALNIAVDDVVASDLVAVETHNLVLDQILDLLDRYGVAGLLTCLGDVLCRIDHLAVGKARAFLDLQVCGADRIDDLIDVKGNLGAAALDDLHPLASFAS